MKTTHPVIDYRRKERLQPDLRVISDPPITDLVFTLRALFVATCIYLFLTSTTFPLVPGINWRSEWRNGGFLIMLIDSRYPTTKPLYSDFINSILASSTPFSWPYAKWIHIPAWLALPSFPLTMALFWRLTRPRKRGP